MLTVRVGLTDELGQSGVVEVPTGTMTSSQENGVIDGTHRLQRL